MIKIGKKESFFTILIVIGTITSIILSSLYYSHIEKKLTNEFTGLRFVLKTDSFVKSSLIYSYNKEFNSKSVLNDLNPSRDTLLFIFPKSDSIVKKFRLDFGNDVKIEPLKIKELVLLFKNDQIVLKGDEVLQRLFNISSSIALDKKNGNIKFKKDAFNFDPYIVFSPLVEYTVNKRVHAVFLLSPFLVLLFVFFITYKGDFQLSIKKGLLLVYIICIPLKIAWTTFITILLCIYGLVKAIIKREYFINKWPSYLFLAYFLILLVIGRPTSLFDIDIQLGLLLWAIISATIHIPKILIYKFYTGFIVFLNAVLLASGISFLFWFNRLYGLQLADYLNNIKSYSRDIRSWLYYDHAAFLAFFGIVGVLFLHHLFKKKLVSLKWVWLYHIMLLSLICVTATRIGFIIYLFVLLNALLTLNHRSRMAFNSLFFVAFTALLFINIKDIDKSRSALWKTSWELIKERPLFGHGLGQSDKILHAAYSKNINIGAPVLILNHSHNQYLTYLMEIGFAGALLLFISLLYFLTKTKQFKNNMLITYVFALGLLLFTESALQTSKPLYVFCFLFLVLSKNYPRTKLLGNSH